MDIVLARAAVYSAYTTLTYAGEEKDSAVRRRLAYISKRELELALDLLKGEEVG